MFLGVLDRTASPRRSRRGADRSFSSRYPLSSSRAPKVGSSRRWPSFSRFYDSRYIHTLEDSHRCLKGPSARQCVRVDRPGSPGQQDRRYTAVRTSSWPSPASGAHTRSGTRSAARAGARASMLQPCAFAKQRSKEASTAASHSLLPLTECSPWSGCMRLD